MALKRPVGKAIWLPPRGSDPELTSGLLWFNSNAGRLRFTPDGTTIQEFVNRSGDTMTGDLRIDKADPAIRLRNPGGDAYILGEEDTAIEIGDGTAPVRINGSYSRVSNLSVDKVTLDSLSADPTLTAGLLWFRSDLGRLRFSPDGTEVQELSLIHI